MILLRSQRFSLSLSLSQRWIKYWIFFSSFFFSFFEQNKVLDSCWKHHYGFKTFFWDLGWCSNSKVHNVIWISLHDQRQRKHSFLLKSKKYVLSRFDTWIRWLKHHFIISNIIAKNLTSAILCYNNCINIKSSIMRYSNYCYPGTDLRTFFSPFVQHRKSLSSRCKRVVNWVSGLLLQRWGVIPFWRAYIGV